MGYSERNNGSDFEPEEREKKLRHSIYLSIFIGLAAIAFWIFLFAKAGRFVNIPIGAAMFIIAVIILDNIKNKKPAKKLGAWAVKWFGLYIAVGDALFQAVYIITSGGKIADITEKLVYGLLSAAVGVFAFRVTEIYSELKKQYCTLETEAVAAAYDHRYDGEEHRDEYALILEYQVNGKTVRHKEDIYKSVREFEIMQKITIWVDPDDPQDILRVDKNNSFVNKLIGMVLIILGAIYIL